MTLFFQNIEILVGWFNLRPGLSRVQALYLSAYRIRHLHDQRHPTFVTAMSDFRTE